MAFGGLLNRRRRRRQRGNQHDSADRRDAGAAGHFHHHRAADDARGEGRPAGGVQRQPERDQARHDQARRSRPTARCTGTPKPSTPLRGRRGWTCAATQLPQPEMHIRADGELAYKHVAQIMADAARAGLDQTRFRHRSEGRALIRNFRHRKNRAFMRTTFSQPPASQAFCSASQSISTRRAKPCHTYDRARLRAFCASCWHAFNRVSAAPAAASLAFMPCWRPLHWRKPQPRPRIAAPAASETTLPTVKVEDTADPMAVNNGYQATETRVGKVRQDPHDVPQAVTTVTHQLMEEQQVGSPARSAAQRVGPHLQRRRRRPLRRQHDAARLLYLRRHVSRRHPRHRAVQPRNLLPRTDRRAARLRLDAVRPRPGRRRHQPRLQDAQARRRLQAHRQRRHRGLQRSHRRPQQAAGRRQRRAGEPDEARRRQLARKTRPPAPNPKSIAAARRSASRSACRPTTSSTSRYLYLRNRDIPDYGFSFDNATRRPNTNFSLDTFWGIDRNFDDSDVNVTTATWTHRFSPKTELRTSVRYGDYERSYWARTPSPTVAPGDTGLNLPSTNTGPDPFVGLRNAGPAIGPDIQLPRLGHEARSGRRRRISARRQPSRGAAQPWRHQRVTPPVFQPYVEGTGGLNNFTSDSYAIYLQDTVEFMPFWKATLGVRRDQLTPNTPAPPRPNWITASGAIAPRCRTSPPRRRTTTSATAIRSARPPICIS